MSDFDEVKRLEEQAEEVRKTVLAMIDNVGSGHYGGSLSVVEIMTALYFSELNIRPQEPDWDGRDRIVLSKGHACLVLYACLSLRGYFDRSPLLSLRKKDSILQEHLDTKRCPGIDISAESLEQGLSAGVGMAVRAKQNDMEYRTFVLLRDGETQEGQVWEAAQTAAKYALDNLVALVDNNSVLNEGLCEEIIPTADLAGKFAAFGFDTYTIEGHNIGDILKILRLVSRAHNGRPKCIVAKTSKG